MSRVLAFLVKSAHRIGFDEGIIGILHFCQKISRPLITNCLKLLPLRLLSGPTFEYDPATSMLHHMGDGIAGGYHMIIAFGAPQVWMELAELLDDREWEDMLSEFGEFYTLSDEEKRKKSGGALHLNIKRLHKFLQSSFFAPFLL